MKLRTIIAGGLGILFAAFLLFVGIFIPSPSGFLIAAPKKPILCDVPNFAARSSIIDSTVSGGVFTGQSFNLPGTLNLEIRSDLYIVATGDLKVHGTIMLARRNPSGEIINPSANITLASLKGNVIIDGAAFIGWEQSAPLPIADRVVSSGNPVHAGLATGRIGRNGGQIRILAPMGTVSNKAEIVGFHGEEGGEAEDDTGKYGFANGVGGGGGHGGDIVICHKDGFENDAKIRAGNGGMGGRGSVNASRYMAESLGGPGGDGGNVIIRGTAAPTRSSVVNSGIFAGGLGGAGGDARTYAQNFWPITITAEGAYGGKGGTVIFEDVELDPVGEVSNAVGGGGGWADAVAGNGPVTWGIGIRGGSAEAFGGNAGKDGDKQIIPVPPGNPPGKWSRIVQLAGGPPKGGTAMAQAGSGGNGKRNRAKSGVAYAQAGVGRSGKIPKAVAPYGPAPSSPPGGGGNGGSVQASGQP